MGADGGSLPTRSEQIKKKQQEARTDPLQRARMKLSLCALSSLPLDKSSENIACDVHGNLFSLEQVLDCLLDAEKKQKLKSQFGIRRRKTALRIWLRSYCPAHCASQNARSDPSSWLQDLTVLKANINPEYLLVTEESDEFVAPFICPFTQELSNGAARFVVIRPCGHVVSHNALKELTLTTSAVPTEAPLAPSNQSSLSSPSGLPISTPPSKSSASNTNCDSTPSPTCITCSASYKHEEVIELPSAGSSTLLQDGPGDSTRSVKKRVASSTAPTSMASASDEEPPQAKKPKR